MLPQIIMKQLKDSIIKTITNQLLLLLLIINHFCLKPCENQVIWKNQE